MTWVASIRLFSNRAKRVSSSAVLRTSWLSSVSLKMDAVSARGMGGSAMSTGTRSRHTLCQPCPSSCASVLTSLKLPTKLVSTRLIFI